MKNSKIKRQNQHMFVYDFDNTVRGKWEFPHFIHLRK